MTFAAAHSAIRKRFETQWGSTTTVQYPNKKFSKPDNASWVRLNIVQAASAWASMGDPGNNTERNFGQVSVQIFVPVDIGEGDAVELADQVRDVFRDYRDATSGVRFLVPPYARQIGDDGIWYQINVVAPFQFDDYT